MGIYIKDAATDKAVRKLAKLRGVTITEVVRSTVSKALSEENASGVDDAAVDALVARFAALPKTGLKADKEFFDSLSDE